MTPITSAYEEKALLGKVGAKFDTPEKVQALLRFRFQQQVANRLLFRSYPWETIKAIDTLMNAEEEELDQ